MRHHNNIIPIRRLRNPHLPRARPDHLGVVTISRQVPSPNRLPGVVALLIEPGVCAVGKRMARIASAAGVEILT
jgi:hypothetical protein